MVRGAAMSGNIALSPDQVSALNAAAAWFNDDARSQRPFRLFGLAGTGKSTVVDRLVADIGLSKDEVIFTATTGKAAKVLGDKGCPATTVHRAFYRCISSDEEYWGALASERSSLGAKLTLNSKNSAATRWRERILEIDAKLRTQRPIGLEFKFTGVSNISSAARLVVVDEASMLDDVQFEDLCGLGIPVILVGDHGQLPPVNGGTKVAQNIDVALETIHRQAKDSSILEIAQRARGGRGIPEGNPEIGVEVRSGGGARSVEKMIQNAGLTLEDLASADQIICGTNNTRDEINEMMRTYLCNGQKLPTGHSNEKLIVTKNFYEDGANIMNGSFIRVTPSTVIRPRIMGLDRYIDLPVRVVDIDDEPASLYSSLWRTPFECGPKDSRRKTEQLWARSTIQAEWGWAITAHKSQGSQWDRVCVFNESRYFRDDAKRWLYTAVTRAKRELLLIHP